MTTLLLANIHSSATSRKHMLQAFIAWDSGCSMQIVKMLVGKTVVILLPEIWKKTK